MKTVEVEIEGNIAEQVSDFIYLGNMILELEKDTEDSLK
jgi:hypothetical protein